MATVKQTPAVTAIPTKKRYPHIGCRWSPDHVYSKRNEDGSFEALNLLSIPATMGESERVLQAGLLEPVTLPWISARIEAARVARSPRRAPVIEYRTL